MPSFGGNRRSRHIRDGNLVGFLSFQVGTSTQLGHQQRDKLNWNHNMSFRKDYREQQV
jgi:hypothetical protein